MQDLSTVVRRGHPIVFGIFALFSIIVAIIASAVVADFNSNGNPQSSIRDPTRFEVFAGWWGFLFSIIYVCIPTLTRSCSSSLVSVVRSRRLPATL